MSAVPVAIAGAIVDPKTGKLTPVIPKPQGASG